MAWDLYYTHYDNSRYKEKLYYWYYYIDRRDEVLRDEIDAGHQLRHGLSLG